MQKATWHYVLLAFPFQGNPSHPLCGWLLTKLKNIDKREKMEFFISNLLPGHKMISNQQSAISNQQSAISKISPF